MTELIAWCERQNTLFHEDKRVRAARRQYRADLKTMSEQIAWARQKQVIDLVRKELDRKYPRPK